MLNWIANWRREREAVLELSRLTDRELADLGIARADIRAVAAGAYPVADEDVRSSRRRSADSGDTLAPAWAAHNRTSLAA